MQAIPRCDRVGPRVQYRSVPLRDGSFPRSTACTACTPFECIDLSATNNFSDAADYRAAPWSGCIRQRTR
jgi:hypothetical protein